jgi:hypothetical protein
VPALDELGVLKEADRAIFTAYCEAWSTYVTASGRPYDPATRRLFGVPVTTSNAQAAGVGHVLASSAVALDTDTRGVDVQWSENATADSFGKNLVFARCEGRWALQYSPRLVW